MKRCPECRRDYTDETLNFCLDDGAALLDGPGSEFGASDTPTAVLHTVDLPSERPTLRDTSVEHAAGSGSSTKWIVGAAVLALIAAGAYWFVGRDAPQPASLPQPKLTQITVADGIEAYPTWSPDGTKLAYSGELRGVQKIFIKQLDTGAEQQLTHGEADDIQASWSPNGSQILFVRAQKPNQKLQPIDVFGS